MGRPSGVHAVGGLKDTLRHGGNGSHFGGATVEAQVDRPLPAALIRRLSPTDTIQTASRSAGRAP